MFYASRVGVAPGTTTLQLDGAGCGLGIQCFPVPPPLSSSGPTRSPPRGAQPSDIPGVEKLDPRRRWRFRVPYESISDMKGLGLINETDRWRTGTPNRLPGTIVLHIPGSGGGNVQLMGPDDLLPPSDEPSTVTMRTSYAIAAGIGTLLLGALAGFAVSRNW